MDPREVYEGQWMREIRVKFSHYDLGLSKSAAGHAHYELDAQSGEGN